MKQANIIANLGSPSEQTEEAAEILLREFLSDPFVLPIPFPFRNFLAYRIAKKRKGDYLSALKSVAINGKPPITAYTESLAKKVERLTGRDTFAAYRYGKNNLKEIVEKAMLKGAERISIIPTYPQNSKPTTQTMKAEIEKIQKRSKVEISFRESYCDFPAYIDALAETLNQTKIDDADEFRSLIISFHSVPLSMARGYAEECEKTAKLLSQKLDARNVLIGWQSKMGKGKWLEPSTESLVKKLAKRGVKNVTVICPGFATDCTETLVEINKTLRDDFFKYGGEHFDYIPCLNDSDAQANLFAKLFEEMN